MFIMQDLIEPKVLEVHWEYLIISVLAFQEKMLSDQIWPMQVFTE